jgi:hypothetical protein
MNRITDFTLEKYNKVEGENIEENTQACLNFIIRPLAGSWKTGGNENGWDNKTIYSPQSHLGPL